MEQLIKGQFVQRKTKGKCRCPLNKISILIHSKKSSQSRKRSCDDQCRINYNNAEIF